MSTAHSLPPDAKARRAMLEEHQAKSESHEVSGQDGPSSSPANANTSAAAPLCNVSER